MPKSRLRKNRKPFNPRRDLKQLATIKVSGIALDKLRSQRFKEGKTEVLLNKNGAASKYWVEKDIFIGKSPKLSSILQKLKILGVNSSYKNRKDNYTNNKKRTYN